MVTGLCAIDCLADLHQILACYCDDLIFVGLINLFDALQKRFEEAAVSGGREHHDQ